MLDPELKTKWVAALRSGKYTQGKGSLRNKEDNYCCLGVLCDIVGVEWSPTRDGKEYDALYEGVGNPSVLPDTLSSAIGLDPQYENMLVQDNDSGMSFGQIAQTIERIESI